MFASHRRHIDPTIHVHVISPPLCVSLVVCCALCVDRAGTHADLVFPFQGSRYTHTDLFFSGQVSKQFLPHLMTHDGVLSGADASGGSGYGSSRNVFEEGELRIHTRKMARPRSFFSRMVFLLSG